MGIFTDDIMFLKYAYGIARGSRDNSTQNGAVLVDPFKGIPVAFGYNDILTSCGVLDLASRRERPTKYLFTEHAERAAIFYAANRGIQTEGAWLYCPWVACADCARAIILAGITRVIGHKHPYMAAREDWDPSIKAGMQMFEEAMVKVDFIEDHLGESILFNGKQVVV